LALAACSPAYAADFKGFYIGANLGGAFSNSDAHTFPAFSPTGYFNATSPGAISTVGTQSLGSNGFNGGGLLGFNFQHNSFVAGLEFDFGAMNLSASKSGTGTYPCCAPTGFTVTQSTSSDWLLTVRPRVGVTHGPFLLYGTAGLAVTNVNYQALFTDTFATAHENGGVDSTEKGWVGGGGIEIKPGKRWSFKGEFLHADFGNGVKVISTNLTAPSTTSWPQNPFTHTADLSANLARFGVNFHF